MLDKILEIDGQILLWIQENLRMAPLTPVVKAITYSGNAGIIAIVTAIILMIIPKTRRLGFLCGAALIVDLLVINLTIKPAVARIRPYEAVEGLKLIISHQHDPSFPSGHSAAAFTIAAVMLYEVPRRISIPVLLFAFLMGFSRLYVGVHYPTDVLCGAMIGVIIGLTVCVVYHRCIAKNKARLHR